VTGILFDEFDDNMFIFIDRGKMKIPKMVDGKATNDKS